MTVRVIIVSFADAVLTMSPATSHGSVTFTCSVNRLLPDRFLPMNGR